MYMIYMRKITAQMRKCFYYPNDWPCAIIGIISTVNYIYELSMLMKRMVRDNDTQQGYQKGMNLLP
jgi:hypothetical protein